MRLSRRNLFLFGTSSLVAATLFNSPAYAATGDITAITIEATGWSALVTIAGFTTGETFAFGDPFLSAAKFQLTVTTTGFDASGGAITPTQTIYGTHVVRKAYPNNANNDETGSSPVVVRIALSEWIASGDTVVANVTAGCFINTGGAAQTSNTLTALSCTNSSTYVHPGAMGQWASRAYDRWTANPTLSVTARHRLGIACVKIILTDGTNTVTTTATKQSNQRSATNASGYYAEEWTATCSLSTLTQNTAITARFQVFPAIGASFDSNTPTQNADNKFCLGVANIPFWNDKSAALDVFAVVNQSTGNDTTGVSSATLATALASPYATIAKALTVGTANIIYLKQAGTQTYVYSGATVRPSDKNYWRRILPYPGDTGIIVTMTGTVQPNVQALSIENVQYKMLAGANWIDGQTTDIYAWDNVSFNANSITSNTVPVIGEYRALNVYVKNSTIDSADAWGLNASFAAHLSAHFDGCVITMTGVPPIVAAHRVVACKGTGATFEDPNATASTAAKPDPYFFEFNGMFKCTDGNPCMITSAAATRGNSLCGNIIERASGVSSPLVQVNADANTNTSVHFVAWHNTIPGQRANLMYNETGTTSHLMTGSSLKFNSFYQRAIKSDTFGTPSGNRIGNWADLYGVGYINNQEQSNNLGFGHEFPGLDTSYFPATPTAASPVSTPNYTNDASTTGSGLGNGNYLPTAGSTLLNGVPSGQAVLGWDLFGTAINNAGSGTAGAAQVAAASAGSRVGLLGVGR